MNKETFTIKNDLLYSAIWGEDRCKRINFTGYVYSDKKRLGRAFLEYCICRIFDIHRLPGCGYDRFNEGGCKFAILSQQELEDACEELRALYDFTQKRLLSSSRLVEGKIELVRCLSDFEKREIISQLQDKDRRDILLPVNVFTSYAHDGIRSSYPGELYKYQINLKEYVDVKNILLWDSYVSYYNHNDSCGKLCYMGDCEAEVFVINHSINGWRHVDRDCFVYDSLPKLQSSISSKPILEHDIRLSNSAVFEENCIYIKPCDEDDCITKWVMKRNMKKYNVLREDD